MGNWIGRVGELRDGLLALAAGVYGAGIVVWSVYAYSARIAIVPIVDSRYFVAGVAPLAVIGLYILVLKQQLTRRIADRVNLRGSWAQMSAAVAATVLMILSVLLPSYMARRYSPHDERAQLLWQAILTTVFNAGVILTGTFIPQVLRRSAAPFRATLDQLTRLWSFGLAAAAFVIFMFIYALWVLPSIPPQIGGAEPIPATLVIDKPLELDGTTAKGAEREGTRLSVELVYQNSDFVVFSMLDDPNGPRYHVPTSRIRLLVMSPRAPKTSP